MMQASSIPSRQIRARFNESTIRVYQAYSPAIAMPAVKAQRFVSPFKIERMTWIKPSFCWMMYRSGWAKKEGQERVLAIDITREGFEWALSHACLSHFKRGIHASHEAWQTMKKESPVRIQWDPERDWRLNRFEHRSIQIGLSGEAVDLYVNKWITTITDVTETLHEIHANQDETIHPELEAILDHETEYSVSEQIRTRIGMSEITVD